MISRRGIGFIVVALGLFAVGDVTRTGWVQIGDSILWGAIILGIVLPLASGFGVDAAPRFGWNREAQGVGPVQGDELTLSVRLRNPQPWPRFGLVVAFDLTVNGEARPPLSLYVPYLGPRAELTVDGRFPRVGRGVHTISGGSVRTSAPFGFFRRRARFGSEATVTVHPAPVTVEQTDTRVVLSGTAPRPVTARWGEEISGSRPYAPGDPARDIHWKNSARAGRLMTKAYTASATDERLLVIGAPDGESSAMDDVARVAAGVGLAWGGQGQPVALLVDGVPRRVTYPELSAYLAAAAPATVPPLASALRAVAQASSVGVVVCASDDAGLAALATEARSAGVRAWLLGDTSPEEAERAAVTLRGAGVSVELVPLPLPEPEVEE